MALFRARSPLPAYLGMAALAVVVVATVTRLGDRARLGTPIDLDGRAPPVTVVPFTPAPAIERDFLTTVIGDTERTREHRYCDRRGCCPTLRTTFGTTAPIEDVIASFEAQGYHPTPAVGRRPNTGPWPPAIWTAEFDYAGRDAWRRVEVARGPDVDRDAWPTVFVESSARCG